MEEIKKYLQNHRLTTAKILYHMPDYPELLQTFVWQKLDLAPKYPALSHFLNYWERYLDGKLHSVVIAQRKLITPYRFEIIKDEWHLN